MFGWVHLGSSGHKAVLDWAFSPVVSVWLPNPLGPNPLGSCLVRASWCEKYLPALL